MKRRESGKSVRHARQDGWRAPLLTMLKYCRHKTRPKIVIENTDQRNARSCQDGTFNHNSPTAQQFGRRILHLDIPHDTRPGRAYATEADGDKVPKQTETSGRSQKTLLARSNQPFSSAVNGLTAWLVVASGRAKAAGGGA